MSTVSYALIKTDNTIANSVVIDEGDLDTLNSLIEFHNASYALNLQEVGDFNLITDKWNPSTNSWETLEIFDGIDQIDWSTAIQKPE